MKHEPLRTCIGCRGTFPKDQVVRIVAGPEGAVLDYREKLPSRAAYVCPSRECIEKALSRDNLSRALKQRVKMPAPAQFISVLLQSITEKIRSLTVMAAKAGRIAAGYSAVQDAAEKGRVEMLIHATDLSEGTREKLEHKGGTDFREATLFTRDELGKILNRELVGVIAFTDKGLAEAVWNEWKRLKSLINEHE